MKKFRVEKGRLFFSAMNLESEVIKLDVNNSIQVSGFESVKTLRDFFGDSISAMQRRFDTRYYYEVNESDLTYTIRRLN